MKAQKDRNAFQWVLYVRFVLAAKSSTSSASMLDNSAGREPRKEKRSAVVGHMVHEGAAEDN